MKPFVVIVAIQLILLTGCVPTSAPAPSTVPTVALPTAAATIALPTPSPSASPSPSVRQVTRTPRYRYPTWPPVTPLPTCVPELDAWEEQIRETPGAWIEVAPAAFAPLMGLNEEQRFQDYTIRIYQSAPGETNCCCGASLEILRGTERVYATHGLYRFYADFSYDDQEGQERHIPIGQDMTGDGIPDLLITQWTGGAHCCTMYRLFQLGDEFRVLGAVYAGDYDSQIADLDGDGNWEFIVHDWAYAYNGPWAEAGKPGPYVILHYTGDGYHLAGQLMRKPAPTTEELQALAEPYVGNSRAAAQGRFWEDAVGLVYSGHPESLISFLELVWPDDPTQRAGFLDWMLSSMHESLYWPEIKDLADTWPWPED
jgi:hypothetical protein